MSHASGLHTMRLMDQILIVVIMATIQDYASSLSLPLPKEYVGLDTDNTYLSRLRQEIPPVFAHRYPGMQANWNSQIQVRADDS